MQNVAKIANFSELLRRLAARTLYGFCDVRTMTITKDNVYFTDPGDGIVYDSLNDNQLVAIAGIFKNETYIKSYVGNFENNTNKELDSIVKVYAYNVDTDDPYVEVEVTGNDSLYTYRIKGGQVELKWFGE